MGRRRYQQPSVFKTAGKRPMWYFRARVDILVSKDGGATTEHKEGPRKYLGYVDEMTKQEAKKRRDEILADAINKPQVLIPSQVQFADVLKIYRRDHLAHLRETTRSAQECIIAKYVDKTLGKMRMCDIDTLAIQRWLSGMDLSYSTKKHALKILRLIWGKAEEWGFTRERFPKGAYNCGVNRRVKGDQLPTMDQLRKLLAALEDPYRAMAEIALYSGLRISEIRGLKWEDVSGDRVMVRRRISSLDRIDVPKSERSIRVLDARPLTGALGRIARESDWIFHRSDRTYWMAARQMQESREAAGITIARFGWHHLRGIFNTLVREYGADSVDRLAMMGHSDERVNSLYVMQAESDLRRRGNLMLAVQSAIMGDTKGVQ